VARTGTTKRYLDASSDAAGEIPELVTVAVRSRICGGEWSCVSAAADSAMAAAASDPTRR